jgi:hypothetical protein
MNRRSVLKQLAVATTAAMLLPSCIADPKKVSIALKNLDINGDEEELLASIADTIIPAVADKPGAKGVGAHLFTLVMVDECTDKLTKEKYLRGLRSFDETCKTINGKKFTKSEAEQKLALLAHLEKNRDTLNEDTKTFYFTSRGYILHGYLSSQYFLTEVKPYQLVPGPDFRGCAPVSETPLNV